MVSRAGGHRVRDVPCTSQSPPWQPVSPKQTGREQVREQGRAIASRGTLIGMGSNRGRARSRVSSRGRVMPRVRSSVRSNALETSPVAGLEPRQDLPRCHQSECLPLRQIRASSFEALGAAWCVACVSLISARPPSSAVVVLRNQIAMKCIFMSVFI